MLTEEALLSKAKKLVEEKIGWGNSTGWKNQDFIALGKKIQQGTGATISHITLKRLWGKVKYDGLPQTYTLNTLVQFIGYESWRDFVVKNEKGTGFGVAKRRAGRSILKPVVFALILIGVAGGAMLFISATKKKIDPKDYAFSSRQVLKAGLPNSAIFDFDVSKAPGDSVIIQQSWDTRLRTKVAKAERQHTLIYYYPGYFKPKLIVDGQIVKEHSLLIRSDGWMSAIMSSPMPVYFKKSVFLVNGKMSLPVTKIKEQNINLTPQAPQVSFINVQDFGEIYSDNFVFETSLRNDYQEGSSVCQMTNIYLLCEGTAINIPLCAKGCESALNFFFTDYKISGKKKDLSGFGVDFNSFVKVRVEAAKGKARIFINDKLACEVDHDISKVKIIGIDYVFQGTGSVDYVKLSNREVNFDDEF